MPFVTEELWQKTTVKYSASLIVAEWPNLSEKLVSSEINLEMDWVIRLISQIRGLRSEMNIPAAAILPVSFKGIGDNENLFLKNHSDIICRLARVSSLSSVGKKIPSGAIQLVIDQVTIFLSISDAIDVKIEKDRIKKEISYQQGEILRFEKKLENEKFLKNAPKAIVEEQKRKLENANKDLIVLKEAEARLRHIK